MFRSIKKVNMMLANGTKFLRRAMAVTAPVVFFMALAAVPALAQEPPCTPGTIVDFCRDVPPGHGFVRDKNGVFTTIDVQGALLTVVWDINNRGQMVGPYVDAKGPTSGGFTHGFLLEDGVFTTIDVPGAWKPRSSASTTTARWWARTAAPTESPMDFS